MPSVRDTIVQQVDEWLAREVPRVRDEGVLSSIKFTIKAPGGDDDNTLVLDLDVDTRTQLYFDEEQGLRVEGVPFDADEPLRPIKPTGCQHGDGSPCTE